MSFWPKTSPNFARQIHLLHSFTVIRSILPFLVCTCCPPFPQFFSIRELDQKWTCFMFVLCFVLHSLHPPLIFYSIKHSFIAHSHKLKEGDGTRHLSKRMDINRDDDESIIVFLATVPKRKCVEIASFFVFDLIFFPFPYPICKLSTRGGGRNRCKCEAKLESWPPAPSSIRWCPFRFKFEGGIVGRCMDGHPLPFPSLHLWPNCEPQWSMAIGCYALASHNFRGASFRRQGIKGQSFLFAGKADKTLKLIFLCYVLWR